VRSALYTGVLMHHRMAPDHVFRHPVCFYVLDLDELPELDRRLRLFGYNRPNLFSIRDADHLGDADRPIKENILAWLAERGVDLTGGRVMLLTNIRTFGYGFNPVSFFYCYDAQDRLHCVVAEVANTFGERRPYLLDARNLVSNGGTSVWRQQKELHVSPFFGLDQTYEFRLTEPGDRISTRVDLFDGEERVFLATQSGTRTELSDAALAKTMTRFPLMGQKVIGLIHLEALKLWRKGATLHNKPRFTAADGSRADVVEPAPPATPRRALRELPAAPRVAFPVGPIRSLVTWALSHPDGGVIDLKLPNGVRRSFGDPASPRRASLEIHSKDLYRRLATRRRIGIGESYVAGDWDSDNLVGLLETLFLTADAVRTRPPGATLVRLQALRPHLPRRNRPPQARRHIAYHYDIGNDLYELFLDPTWTYSCAYFASPDETLEQAQRNKYQRICDKLALTPDDHVLEIGCGWGGFALHAAGHYGCRVTGVTVSDEQHALACDRVRAAGLDDLIDIRLTDYRTLSGQFSKIASIEMFEAIGEAEFDTFFATCDRLLGPGGIACVQTIAIPDHRFERYRRTPDWIQEYIFPGSLVPSLAAMTASMARASELIVHGVEDIGINYADTLRLWREKFTDNLHRVRALGYDEQFIRTWTFYLASCEAAFRTRGLHDYQVVLTRAFNDRLSRYPDRRAMP
jgi:cyclopropane-fatty-acyl-phospholipid synthase